jgi:hypothetical protein
VKVAFVATGNWRVVVSDRDPFLNGVVAHLVGVGLPTALKVMSAPDTEVAVEVLGTTDLSNPRMAAIQGQRFSARHINHLAPTDRVLQIVTITGCGAAKVEQEFLRRCDAPVISLSRYDLDGSWDHATMHVDDAPNSFHMHPDGAGMVSDNGRIADLCQAVSEELASRLGRA